MCMRVNGGGGWCVSSFQAALLTLTFHYIYDFTTADLKKKEKKILGNLWTNVEVLPWCMFHSREP